MTLTYDSDTDLLAQAAAEIAELQSHSKIVVLNLGSTKAMAVISALQLACRHPAFRKRPTYKHTREVIASLAKHFQPYHALTELIRRGELQEYDE